jgi:hypothetical protein
MFVYTIGHYIKQVLLEEAIAASNECASFVGGGRNSQNLVRALKVKALAGVRLTGTVARGHPALCASSSRHPRSLPACTCDRATESLAFVAPLRHPAPP